ncbi:MAG: DUF2079 domain-containing protein [Candidatus Omnitrophica bacterium]|nr:DUF2079 domain-containing protein [Candidatus Omnitrophota bacterium]
MRDKICDLWAVGLCFLAAAVWIGFNYFQFTSFGYKDWDLALYAQVSWNICRGSCSSTLWGMNFLGNHAEYIAFFAAPIYCLFRHPLTLLVLNALLFAFGAYIFYVIARYKLGHLPGLMFLLFYLLHPANIYMLSYEFHFESFAPCFIFLAYYFFERDRFRAFFITCLALCLIKENIVTIVVMFGFLGLFFKGKKRWLWGLAPIALGCAVFYLELFVLIPYFHKISSQSVYWSMYQSYGSTPVQIAGNIATQPAKLFFDIFSAPNRLYFQQLFGPHLLFALISPHILALGLPIFLQNLLATAWTNHTIYFHYAATVVPMILLAVMNTFALFKKVMTPVKFLIIVFVLSVGVAGHSFNNCEYLARRVDWWWGNPLNSHYERLVRQVDKNEPVVASFAFLGHLTERPELYSFYYVAQGSNSLNGLPFVLPSRVRTAVLDFDEPELFARFSNEPLVNAQRINREFFYNGWKWADSTEDLVLLKKDLPEGRLLVEVLPAPALTAQGQKRLNFDIALSAVRPVVQCAARGDCRLEVRFDWLSLSAEQISRAVRMQVTQNGRSFYVTEHIPGYMIYPSVLWKKNDLVREYFVLRLPPLAAGSYDLELGLIPASFDNFNKYPAGMPLDTPMRKVASFELD